MRKQIITTLILLVIAVIITVMYFNNLNPPGQQSGKVMKSIPADAAMIFEYKNDQSFYDIFKNNKLLGTFIGDQKSAELNDLKNALLDNPLLKGLFGGQSVFISLHPQKSTEYIEFLITTSSTENIGDHLDQVSKENNKGMLIHQMMFNGKPGYNIYLNQSKKRFYLVLDGENIFSASFSRQLVEAAARYHDEGHDRFFAQLSDQQNSNSIANLYINYAQLSPLFDQIFKSKNTDICRDFRLLPALGALSLNYKSDALMFNGMSHIEEHKPKSYLSLFRYQQPTENQLKDIFPATTAYSLNFAVSDPVKFESTLLDWQSQNGINNEEKATFNKIKTETGVDLMKAFTNLLGNEFAVITTRYQEKLAIIKLKNGLNLRPFMVNISKMVTDDIGQFNYDKLPYYLLGDAFGVFKRPYFMIADNYLLLCNSQAGLTEYYKNYTNANFLSKNEQYISFDNLQAPRSNVSFFIHFKNASQLLKQQLKLNYAQAFSDTIGWNNYYAASYQFTSSEKDFYTNFYMKLNMVNGQ